MRRAPALSILFACVAGFAAGGLAVEAGPGELRPSEIGDALRSPRFHVRQVEFTGLQRLQPAALRSRLGLLEAQPLIDVDPDAVCRRLLEHARIATCAALRRPPDRLWVDVEERVPVARLGTSQKGVDAHGVRVALSGGEAGELPRVDGLPEWALPLVVLAAERGLQISSVEARAPNDLVVRLQDVTPVLRLGRDLGRALDNWAEIAERGPEELRSAQEIDLRFDGGAVLRGFSGDKGGKRDGAS